MLRLARVTNSWPTRRERFSAHELEADQPGTAGPARPLAPPAQPLIINAPTSAGAYFAFGQPTASRQARSPCGDTQGRGVARFLPRLHAAANSGRARALEVMLSAGDYDAELAERYGWINRALPANALNDFVRSLATRGGCSCVDGPRLAREGDTLGAINLGQRGYRRVGKLFGINDALARNFLLTSRSHLFSMRAGAWSSNAGESVR